MQKSNLNKMSLLMSLFVFFSFVALSQIKHIEVSHYLFPEFKKGFVVMKTGEKNECMLNYNSLSEEMIFESKGKKLALYQFDLIDTVFVDGRKFFPLNKKFVELIYKSKFELYVQHRCTVKDPGKPAPYGGTSQTSSTDTYSTFFSGGQVYELQLPDGYETRPFVEYLIKKDGDLDKALSMKQLSNQFRDKADLFKEYVKKHDVKFNNQESIVELIRFLEKN